jgi:glucosamine kinase
MIIAGIDGGATRTRAALATSEGTLLGIGIAGPSNYDNVGIAATQANIGDAIARARTSTSPVDAPVNAIFLGMAGVVSPADHNTIIGMVRNLQVAPENRIFVDHDIRTALAGGLAGREGLALIAGTGSSCYGRRRDGRNHRVGWGYLLDDLGSSYSLGHQAMIAAVWEADRRGPATALSSVVQHALGYSHIDEIMRLVYHEGVGVTEIAALAPLVLKTADEGDPEARRIVTKAADDLSYSAYTVARVLAFTGAPFDMAIVGGLAESGKSYRSLLEQAIARRMPECRTCAPEFPPVLGAILLALEGSGVPLTPQIVGELKRSYADVSTR